MKNLLLLRHAKSSWKDPGQTDHQRPLNSRGEHDASRMGQLLVDEDIVPDLVICSSAARAQSTSQAVIAASGFAGETIVTDSLYLAEPNAYVEAVSQQSDEVNSIMAVAHNPGIEQLVEELSGQYEPMPTATLVQLAVSIDSWSDLKLDGSAQVLNVWRPKEL